MSPPEVAVLAGRGKTGQAVARALGAAGVGARLVGRVEEERLVAEITGCRAMYVMTPNLHPEEPSLVSGALAAAETAGVARVVYHSVAAPYAPAMPHHLGKAVSEDLLRRSGAEWTILQPCAYLQNLLPGLREPEPALRVPYDPTRRFGLVDLDDVAEAAATVLLDPAHAGATYELGGPALVSVADVATVASRVLDRTVPVERLDLDTVRGADDRETAWLRAMFDYYDQHGLPAGRSALTSLLGRSPTGLEGTLRRELCPTD